MSNEVLNRSLRPRSFDDLVGQRSIIQSIEAQVQAKRIPRSWMFVGQAGNGKTTIARIIALSLQLPPDRFGRPTAEDWLAYPDYCIHEINGSSVTGIDEIRKITEEANYMPPPPSKQRVYIIDEAQKISDSAQNLLLKPTEEPPKTTTWIFCTTHPGKIIPTLRQRCAIFNLSPLGDVGMKKLLERAAKVIGYKKALDPLIDQLNLAGISSPRAVLSSLENVASGMSPQAAVLAGDSEIDTLRICRAFVRGDWATIRKELKRGTPEDARLIRLSILGYLRSIMLSDSPSIPSSRLAGTIRELTTYPPYEDPAMLAWVSAILYQECKKYGNRS